MLRELREERGLDRGTAAEAIGIAESRLADIEAGETDPAWTDVVALLELLEADATNLVAAEPVCAARSDVTDSQGGKPRRRARRAKRKGQRK